MITDIILLSSQDDDMTDNHKSIVNRKNTIKIYLAEMFKFL